MAPEMFNNMGRALRVLRLERQMSLGEAAEKAGMAKSALSRYELGRMLPSSQTLERILAALDVRLSDVDEVLQRMEERQQEPLEEPEPAAQTGPAPAPAANPPLPVTTLGGRRFLLLEIPEGTRGDQLEALGELLRRYDATLGHRWAEAGDVPAPPAP